MVRSTRSSYSCARCYKRKKKCDRRYPSCSQCATANAQCQGLDRGSEAEVPRSLISYLEDAVAQLELERESSGLLRPNAELEPVILPPQEHHAMTSPTSALDAATACGIASTLAKQTAPAMFLSRDSRLALPYYRAFFLGAELPFPLAFQERRTVNVPTSGGAVTQLPPEVADQLMAVYNDRILPQYPLFLRREIHDMFQRFKSSSQIHTPPATPDEQFMVCMMMAIATLTSKARDYRKLVAVAESLRRDAFGHVDLSIRTTKPTITTIQQLLLLAQYGFLLPASTNLWQVVGDATRIALELGLHQDMPGPCELLDGAGAYTRRRIYLTLYSMERSVAITSHRPFAIAGDQLHVSFPLAQDDLSFPDQALEQTAEETPNQQHANQNAHVPFSDGIRFLRLQAETCSVNIGMRPIPNSQLSHESWLADMETRILEIKDSLETTKRHELMVRHAMMILHMPCARNPSPNDPSVLKYFDAAVHVAKGYWDLIESNDLDNPWHATHHSYEAGILILYGLCHHRALIHRQYSMAQVFEVVHQVSGLFILLVKQWPAAQQCGMLFDRLRKGALTFFREEGSPDNSLEARQLKDLVFRENADLLYAREQPSTTISQSSFESMFPDFENDPLSLADSADLLGFFDLFGTGDLDSFSPTLMEDQGAQQDMLQASETTPGRVFVEPRQTAGGAIDESQLRTAMEKLPVCSHCKKRRIKCDTDLPACRNCKRLRKDCSYWDAALSEEIPRKHIYALQQHVENLMQEIERSSSFTEPPTAIPNLINNITTPGLGLPRIMDNRQLSGQTLPNILCAALSNSDDSLDLVFFGATSSFSRLAGRIGGATSLLDEARPFPPSSLLEKVRGSLVIDKAADIPQAEAENLAWLYYRCIELTHPILGQDLIEDTLVQIYGNSSSSENDGDTAAARTRFYLILAISLALLSAQDQRLELVADAYFRKAATLGYSGDQFVHPTLPSLQMLILICVYAWIRPSSTDIWRVLGHASRMCLDMIEVQGSGTMKESADTAVPHRTLYTLETEVAISFGRPSQLPNGQDIPAYAAEPSSTAASDLSTMVYNLARLQSRFHRHVIGNEWAVSGQDNIGGSDLAGALWMATCVQDIKTWLPDWNAQVDAIFARPSPPPRAGDARAPLRLFGELKQAEALLLAKLATDRHGQALVSGEDEIDACRQLLRAADSLRRATAGTSGQMGFLFEITWTRAHAVFTAAVVLLQHAQVGSLLDPETQRLVRAGSDILASREDTTGLAQYVRKMYESSPLSMLG